RDYSGTIWTQVQAAPVIPRSSNCKTSNPTAIARAAPVPAALTAAQARLESIRQLYPRQRRVRRRKMKALAKIAGLALLLAAGTARASLGAVEKLGDQGFCDGGCVDTWQVDCPYTTTLRIEARVRDLIDGRPNVFAVTTLGFSGARPQLGQA